MCNANGIYLHKFYFYSEVNAFQLSLPKADCMLQLYKNYIKKHHGFVILTLNLSLDLCIYNLFIYLFIFLPNQNFLQPPLIIVSDYSLKI